MSQSVLFGEKEKRKFTVRKKKHLQMQSAVSLRLKTQWQNARQTQGKCAEARQQQATDSTADAQQHSSSDYCGNRKNWS